MLLHGHRRTVIESVSQRKGMILKKYRVVRMVVQMQAAITQRRGRPTTLVAWNA